MPNKEGTRTGGGNPHLRRDDLGAAAKAVVRLRGGPAARWGGVYESLAPWNFSPDFFANITGALMVLQVGDVGWSDWGMPTNGSAANRQELEERESRARA